MKLFFLLQKPQTVKMNQIMVKTASFVVKQGLQMEILLKAKQSFNTQFDFLSYDNYLNPYYKHLQQLIKSNQIDPLEFLIEKVESKLTFRLLIFQVLLLFYFFYLVNE